MNSDIQRAARNGDGFFSDETNTIDFSSFLRFATELASRALSHVPLIAAGALLGAAVGLGLGHVFRPDYYEATALFEIIPSPLKSLLNPLAADTSVGERAMRKEKEDQEKQAGEQKTSIAPRKAVDEEKEAKRKEQSEEQLRRTTIATYKTILQSPQIRNKIRTKLQRQGIKEMGSLARVSQITLTNLLEIGVRHSDPYIAQMTADAWASEAIEFLMDLNSQQFQMGKSFLWTQYYKSKKETTDLETRIVVLQKKAQFELKETELAAKNGLLLAYIKDLETLRATLDSAKTTLPTLQQLAQEELAGNAALSAFETGKGKNNISGKLLKKLSRSPEKVDDILKHLSTLQNVPAVVSPLYSQLAKDIREARINLATQEASRGLLEKNVERLTREVTELQADLNENRIALSSMEKDLEIARQQNALIFGKVSEAELAGAMRFADLRLISYSSLPESKTPPNTKKFQTTGGALGAFFGFLASCIFFHLQRPNHLKRPRTGLIALCERPAYKKTDAPREPAEVNV